jgi:hypothetical protein
MKQFAILSGIGILFTFTFFYFAFNGKEWNIDDNWLYTIEAGCGVMAALFITLGLSAYGKYLQNTNDEARRSFELFGEEIHGKMSLFIDDTIKLNKDYNEKLFANIQERQKALDDLSHKDVELLRELLMMSGE